MKFSELPYKRYTIEETTAAFEVFKSAAESAKCAEDVVAARNVLMTAVKHYATAASLCNCRWTLNTHDEFYTAEMGYYDEIGPLFNDLMVKYADIMLSSPFRKELEGGLLNPILFKSYEVAKKSHSAATIELEKEENALSTEYSSLMSQITVEFQGEQRPISYIRGFFENVDRNVRREAANAVGKGLEANQEKLDELFDKLVKNRTAQAKLMGYKDFIELGYYRMGRMDYNREMVEKYRKNVLDDIVPVVTSIKKKVAAKLGIDQIMLYDNDVYSLKGNPCPKLDKDGIFKAAQEMYDEMSPITGDYMRKMQSEEAFDVESREGKWGGGYCTEFADYQMAFILANFNGNSGDVDVMTHEFGHALAAGQCFLQGDYELNVGGMETAECHSMSMEFFSWKYMDKFFFEDATDYRYLHLMNSLSFIPYGVIVDEFQHVIYANPDLTPKQRKEEWNKLEAKYRPYLSTEGITYLEKGNRWQYQMHIYESPFYYIDYCLAQTVALSFLVESRKDYDDAFARYIDFVKAGGTKLFSTLVSDAKLANPFRDGTLKSLAKEIVKVSEELI